MHGCMDPLCVLITPVMLASYLHTCAFAGVLCNAQVLSGLISSPPPRLTVQGLRCKDIRQNCLVGSSAPICCIVPHAYYRFLQ